MHLIRLRKATQQRLILFCIHLIHSKDSSKTQYLYLISCTMPLWTGHRSQHYCTRKDSGLLWIPNGHIGNEIEVQNCHRSVILYLLTILFSFSKMHKWVGGMMGYPLWYIFVSHYMPFQLAWNTNLVCFSNKETVWPAMRTSVMEKGLMDFSSVLFYSQNLLNNPLKISTVYKYRHPKGGNIDRNQRIS